MVQICIIFLETPQNPEVIFEFKISFRVHDVAGFKYYLGSIVKISEFFYFSNFFLANEEIKMWTIQKLPSLW